MTIVESPPTAHPVVGFTARLRGRLGELVDVPVWSMSAAEQRTALVELAAAASQLEELRLRVLAAGDRTDVAAASAASSTAAWVALATRQPRTAAARDVRLAQALDEEFVATRAALASGRMDIEQARVIVSAVWALPESVPMADRERAEKQLLHDAGEHDAVALRMLGRRVFEVLDPDGADAALGRRLEAEERGAARSTYLEIFDNGDGTHAGRFKISTLHAAMLRRALEAFTNPRHRAATSRNGASVTVAEPPLGSDRRLSRTELQGQAFCELLEQFPAHRLPTTGGVSATVVVLMEYDALLSGVGTAALDTGEVVSAGLARQMACEAGIVPAVYRKVLGGPSVVLDLGRETRFRSRYQRLALTIRGRTCTADGCERPAARCHTHHEVPWSQGGPTDLSNGRLLYPFHHGKAHSPGYDMTRLPTGRVQFHRRE